MFKRASYCIVDIIHDEDLLWSHCEHIYTLIPLSEHDTKKNGQERSSQRGEAPYYAEKAGSEQATRFVKGQNNPD